MILHFLFLSITFFVPTRQSLSSYAPHTSNTRVLVIFYGIHSNTEVTVKQNLRLLRREIILTKTRQLPLSFECMLLLHTSKDKDPSWVKYYEESNSSWCEVMRYTRGINSNLLKAINPMLVGEGGFSHVMTVADGTCLSPCDFLEEREESYQLHNFSFSSFVLFSRVLKLDAASPFLPSLFSLHLPTSGEAQTSLRVGFEVDRLPVVAVLWSASAWSCVWQYLDFTLRDILSLSLRTDGVCAQRKGVLDSFVVQFIEPAPWDDEGKFEAELRRVLGTKLSEKEKEREMKEREILRTPYIISSLHLPI